MIVFPLKWWEFCVTEKKRNEIFFFFCADISSQLLTSDGKSHSCLWIHKRISKSCRKKKKNHHLILCEILNSLKMISGRIYASFYRASFISWLLGVSFQIPRWKWKISILSGGLWMKQWRNFLWDWKWESIHYEIPEVHFKSLESSNCSVCGANSLNYLSCALYFHPEVDKQAGKSSFYIQMLFEMMPVGKWANWTGLELTVEISSLSQSPKNCFILWIFDDAI